MDSKPAQPPDQTPKQQLGDTPVPPWQMPTPDEKAKAEPVKEALQQAVEHVDTPEKADQVAESLQRHAGARTTGDVEKTEKAQQPPAKSGEKIEQAADAVQATAQAAPSSEKTSDVIATTVEKIAGAGGRDREVLSQAAQEVLNPEQQGDLARDYYYRLKAGLNCSAWEPFIQEMR